MAEEPLPPASADEPKGPQTIGEAMGALEGAAVHGVDIDIVAVLGTADLKISQILQLGRGAVVELDRLIGEPVDIRAERQLVARGEVVVVEDRLAIQLTEVVSEVLDNG
jgi:flagellar motor switch protein FliN/FliY